MNIAFISKYSYPVKTGGAEISNKLLLDNLQDIDVTPLFENHKFDHIYPFALRKALSYFDMLRSLREKRISLVVITQTNWSSLHGVLLAKLLGSKLIINECGDYWRQPKSYKEHIGKHILNLCDGITTRTQFLKDFILEHHPHLERKIRVIPNSIDLSEYSYVPYDSGTYTFSFFGRLTSAKDPFKILEIAVKLREMKVDFPHQFHIYGRGRMEKDLQKHIDKNDLSDIVQLKGVVHNTNVRDVITHSYLVIMPSTWEPQGRVILESFACGRPILASGVGGMIEALKADNPFICGHDAEKYAHHIVELVKNKDFYERICLENRERSKEFDIKKNAGVFADYFREIVTE